MKFNLKTTKTTESAERKPAARWVSHEEAFKLLELGDRYHVANGKNHHSWAWRTFLQKLNGDHPFDNIHRSHVRRLGRKVYLVLVQKVGFEYVYPKFVPTKNYEKIAA